MTIPLVVGRFKMVSGKRINFTPLLRDAVALPRIPARITRGGHITPGGDQITPRGGHITPGGDQIIPRGEHITPGGDPITPRGEHITPGGDQIIPRGEHITPGGDPHRR